MKKVILVVSLMFGGAALVNAQEQPADRTQSQTEVSTMDQDQEGQQISVSELPEEVTAKLESADYSGWTVGTAYKKMDESQNEIYVVELRQGTETKKVKFDRDGNKIDKKKDKHSDGTESSQYRDESFDNEAETSEDAILESSDDATIESSEDATIESEPQSSEYNTSEDAATEQDATSTEEDMTEQSTTDQADNTELSEEPK